jgi:tetratricopeptide (TPR) repeat protein
MSVSIPTPVWDRFKAKLLQLSPTLFGQLGWILGSFAVVIYLQTPQLASLKQQQKGLSTADLQQAEARAKVRLSLVKMLPALGFDNLVADWHFMEFLQYFGDSDLRRQAGYAAALDYFDVIIDRDPRFLYAYYYLSNTGSLYAGQPERSVALMTQGLKSFTPQVPDRGYYVWRLKGVDELLFLGRVPDARTSMLTAADWARQQLDREGQNVAQVSLNTAKYLARNPNSKQAQFDAWNMVLNAAVDESVVKRAISEIRATGGKVTASPTGEIKVEAPVND